MLEYRFRRRTQDSYNEWAAIKTGADRRFIKRYASKAEPPNGFSPITRVPNIHSNYDYRTWPKTRFNQLDVYQKKDIARLFLLESKDDFDGLCYFERSTPAVNRFAKAHDHLATQVERRGWEIYGGPAGLKYARLHSPPPRHTALSYGNHISQDALSNAQIINNLVPEAPIEQLEPLPIYQSYPVWKPPVVQAPAEASSQPPPSGRSDEVQVKRENFESAIMTMPETAKNGRQDPSLPKRKRESGRNNDEDSKYLSSTSIKRSESSPEKRPRMAPAVKKEEN